MLFNVNWLFRICFSEINNFNYVQITFLGCFSRPYYLDVSWRLCVLASTINYRFLYVSQFHIKILYGAIFDLKFVYGIIMVQFKATSFRKFTTTCSTCKLPMPQAYKGRPRHLRHVETFLWFCPKS